MVRIVYILLVLIGISASALLLAPDRLVTPASAQQNAITTLGSNAQMLDAPGVRATMLVTCMPTGADEEPKLCHGKTLVDPAVLPIPAPRGVSPRDSMASATPVSTLVVIDLRPPKLV